MALRRGSIPGGVGEFPTRRLASQAPIMFTFDAAAGIVRLKLLLKNFKGSSAHGNIKFMLLMFPKSSKARKFYDDQ